MVLESPRGLLDLFHSKEEVTYYVYVFDLFEGDLVDLDGFEPSTSSMPWKRAPNCATGPSLRRTAMPRIEKLDLGWDTLSESAPGHWSVTEYNTSHPEMCELTVWFIR